MQTVKLKLVHAFGSSCSKKYKNCLAICDQDKNQPKIVFPAGKTLARKYIDRSEMDFIQFSQNAENIQCFNVLPTRSHVAVVEKHFGSNLHLIKIYSMTNKEQPHVIKIFNDSDKLGIIKEIVFSSSQPKFMCALIGEPHYKLIFIDTSKNKPLAQSTFTVKDASKISISPQNSHLICVSGGNSIKFYKIQQYAFKPLEDIRKFPKNRIIVDHAWYSKKKMLVATDKSQIFVVQQIKPNVYEVRQQYHNVFNQLQPQKMMISAICPFSKGFILGSDNGKFCLWTRKQDLNSLQGNQKLQLTRKWSTTQQRQAEVTQISINTKQDILVISLSNNDIAILYLNQIIPQISELIKQTSEKQINFEYLYKGFHSKSITGMDICQQRPLFATCSTQDSTIRIWNYKNFGCKLLRMFYFKIKTQSDTQKPLITLAFHPSGYYMAVGCTDKLRIFHVLNNQLRPFRQIGIKKAHIVKFSQGGHFLAVCHQFNEQLDMDHIKVYNSLTLQQIVSFKQNQSIARGLQWKSYDQYLCCVFSNGALLEWRVNDWSVSKKINKKQLQFQCSAYNHGSNSIVGYGYDKNKNVNYLHEFYTQNNTQKNIEVDMKISKIIQITIRKQKSAFVMGLQNGTLVSFAGLDSPTIFSHQNHHLSRINQLILSPCGNFLISCGSDSLIFVYQITISFQNIPNIMGQVISNMVSQQSFSTVVDDFLSDVVLINKKQITKYKEKQKQYLKVIGNLGKKLKLLSQEGEKKQLKNITELQIQKNRIIQDINYRIQKLKDQVQQLKQKNSNSLNSLDNKNIQQAQTLQKNYQQKINFQSQKYFQLQQQLIQLRVLHQKKLQYLHKQEEDQIKSLKRQFESKFKQSQNVFSQTKKQNNQANNIFELRLKQIQEEQQEELREIQNKKQKFKLQTASVLDQLHQKLQKLKKQYSTLQKQKTQIKNQNQQLSFKKKKIQKQVIQTKQKLKDLLIDFDQKIQSLKNKQVKIVEFQQKINQLQKKKHILSYKATELKKVIEPKDFQIEKLKADLIKLKKEFQSSLERKQKANLFLEKLNKEKQYLEKSYNEEKDLTVKEINLIDQLMLDIYFCLQRNSSGTSTDTSNNNNVNQRPSSVSKKSNILSLAKNLQNNTKTQKPQQKQKTIGLHDNKIYFKQIVKLYHKYVDQTNNKITPQNQRNLDQVTKQIVHLQKSLFQINKSNQKNINRKNEEIYKRTKQNTELVNNLNEIKKQNKEFLLKIKSKNIQIQNLKSLKNQLLNNCPKDSTITFKLMNTDQNLLLKSDYKSLKPGQRSSNLTNSGKSFGIRQKSMVNLAQSNIQKMSIINNISNKPKLSQKSLLTAQTPKSNINNYQKRQCQIISEIQFINQKIHKFDFYLKDMSQRIKKHLNYNECKNRNSLEDQNQSHS